MSIRFLTIFSCLAAALSQVHAADAEPPLEEILVIGETVGDLSLDAKAVTGSRLGLSVMETPASVEIVDSAVLRARGYQKLSDAVERLPGVVAGEHPSAPSTFAMRGFTGSQITVLRDGLWIGPSNMVMRPQNTFNLDRVEVLRGPASVMSGIGAIGSTVNAVGKTAAEDRPTSFDILASYGRFDSYQLGIGGGPIGDDLRYRTDVSTYASDGFVKGMDPESTNATASVLWRASDSFSLRLGADYLRDDISKYFGTPLIPLTAARRPMTRIIATETGETIDADMRFNNYNVSDSRAKSDQIFLRADAEWRSGNWTVINTLFRFEAERDWQNAEGYAYCTQVVDVCTRVGDIQRYYGYFFLQHDQDSIGDRLTAKVEHDIGNRRHRFLIGAEVNNLDFVRTRGFRRNVPPAPGDSVDPYDPLPGLYGPRELRGASPTQIDIRAVFAEDAIDVTDAFTLVTAMRRDELDLDRKNFNAAGVLEPNGFTRTYRWWSWRAGGVFRISDQLAVYGQYSDASDPVNANVFLVNSNENFELTDARQWEAGLKANLSGGRTQLTFAYFDIKRDDIFEPFDVDSTRNIGGIDSQGVELATTLEVTSRWKVGANTAYTDAKFARSANVDALTGNRPPNVPRWTANAWTSVSKIAGLPLELGAGARYVGDRYGENTNRILFKSYSLLDAYAAWTHEKYRVSIRMDNITDKAYVAWSDVYYLGQTDPSFIYANQVMLGAPRTFGVTVQAQF